MSRCATGWSWSADKVDEVVRRVVRLWLVVQVAVVVAFVVVYVGVNR